MVAAWLRLGAATPGNGGREVCVNAHAVVWGSVHIVFAGGGGMRWEACPVISGDVATVPRMEIQPFEHHDYLVFMFHQHSRVSSPTTYASA